MVKWWLRAKYAAVMDKAPIGREGPIDASIQLTWKGVGFSFTEQM